MSKPKTKISTKKKVIVAGKNKGKVTTSKKKIQPTRSRKRAGVATSLPKEKLLFGKQNYILMGAGMGLIALGMLLMSGGEMPSPDVWDDSIIYSWRRTVLAPFTMIVGLVLEVYAIFKK